LSWHGTFRECVAPQNHHDLDLDNDLDLLLDLKLDLDNDLDLKNDLDIGIHMLNNKAH
jgi:hypothetical protein